MLSRATDALYRQVPLSTALIFLVTAIFWSVMRPRVNTVMVDVWAVSQTITALLRCYLWFMRTRRPRLLTAQNWLRAFKLSSFLIGCSWGLIFFLVEDRANLALVLPSWMLMFGVISVASGALWYSYGAFLAYTVPIAAAGSGALLLRESSELQWMAPLFLLYLLTSAIFTRWGNRMYLRSLSIEAANGRLVRRLARQAEDQEAIIAKRTAELRRHQRSLEHLANHDALTGLPNRLSMFQMLSYGVARASRSGGRFGLLFLDLDRFKAINDSLGHGVGDDVLRAVSGRLSETVRQADAIARLGGDEFTILLSDLTDAHDAAGVAEKILQAFEAPFQLGDQSLSLGTSIGICVYPDDGSSAEEILRNADTAMYQAKRSGRNAYCRYSGHMSAEALSRVSLESDLRDAMSNGELSVAYQPQVDMRSGQLIGFEALLRWEHPTRGVVPPETFIPVAEDTRLIIELGNWTLQQVGATAAMFNRCGLPPVSFAVNVSAKQLDDDGFEQQIRKLLSRHGQIGSSLELEITERVLVQTPQKSRQLIQNLRAVGIDVAIDNFGTGYSSLVYLRQYPVNKLKIDASFVRDIAEDSSDRTIARAVIALAKSLSIQVVAEGVETEKQRDILLKDGCHLGQGLFYAPALPAEQLMDFAWRANAA